MTDTTRTGSRSLKPTLKPEALPSVERNAPTVTTRGIGKILAFVLLCIIWGSTWLAIKEGYGGLGAFNLASLRFFIAGSIMLALVPLMGARLPHGRTEWLLTVWVGLMLFTADYGLVYWSEQWLDSGMTATVAALIPMFTMLCAHLYLPGERITARKLTGTILSLAGVATLFADTVRLDTAYAGPILGIAGSAFFAAIASVAVKKHGHDLPPAGLNAPAMLIGAVLLMATSIASGEGNALPRATQTWISLWYLAVFGSIVAFLLYFWLLKSWDATTVSLTSVFTPITALFLGYLVRHEQLTRFTALGAVLILAGVVLVTSRQAPD
jgi:drug/metabolite transporter (DMT)-like permease